MYTLRTIYKTPNDWQEVGVITNELLGHYYVTIGKDRASTQFQKELKANDWAKDLNIYAIVRDPQGNLHPLYDWSDHFIMHENGTTFERI